MKTCPIHETPLNGAGNCFICQHPDQAAALNKRASPDVVNAQNTPELARAIVLANKVLDRVNGDPDDDLAILSRQLLRVIESGSVPAAPEAEYGRSKSNDKRLLALGKPEAICRDVREGLLRI